MKKFNLVFYSIFLSILIASCSKDQNQNNLYEKGIFALNQGTYPNGSSALTFIDHNDSVVTDAYALQNNNTKLGSVAQGMAFGESKSYITINNGGSVKIIDSETLISIKDVTGFELPRYVAISENKVFISQWGADGFSGSVKVLENDMITATINTGGAPEKMLLDGNNLYITMTNGFKADDRLLVVDVNTFAITTEITLSKGVNSIIRASDGTIWVACEGEFQVSPDPIDDGRIYQLKNNVILKEIVAPNGCSNLSYAEDKNALFFTNNEGLHSLPLSNPTATKQISTYGFLYGLAYDKESGLLFASDPGDYTTQGKIICFNTEGQKVKSFASAIVPAQIVVK